MRIHIGRNEVENCDGGLEINGYEVFRFLSLNEGGYLICDLDLMNETGDSLVKLSNGQILKQDKGVNIVQDKDRLAITKQDGTKVFEAILMERDTLNLVGEFWGNRHRVLITEESIENGFITIVYNNVDAGGGALKIKPDDYDLAGTLT